MTSASLARIEGQLEARFKGLINLSDVESRDEPQKRNLFLSRALAALCIKALAKTNAATAANAVTDAYHDNDLDAIYYDQREDRLLLVQSKWSNDGKSTLEHKKTLGMAQGVRHLFGARFELFNERVRAKEAEIRAALYSGTTKLVLVTAHTGEQETAGHVKRPIDDLVDELNRASPQSAEGHHFNQAGIYRLITADSEPKKISLPIQLREWGVMLQPFKAYYGHVHAGEVSQWWAEHGNALFTQNLRFVYPNSHVNDALMATLAQSAEHFWYFNNGVTVIADSIKLAMSTSLNRDIGLFTCEGASIVNGAQTVGTIGGNWKAEDQRDKRAWVQVRIISLENCPPEFGKAITRAANLQNEVGYREFAAMDPQQHRLATEFALDRRRYAYRRGEAAPYGAEGCDIEEATVALACDASVTLAVQAKRELGALWANTQAAPYTTLFNEHTSSAKVWRLVQIMRTVEEQLHGLRRSGAPRADLIGVHLNRLILHLVLVDPAMRPLHHEDASEDACLAKAKEVTGKVFDRVTAIMDRDHEYEYPASFSKNYSRCEGLVRKLQTEAEKPVPDTPHGQTGHLFGQNGKK